MSESILQRTEWKLFREKRIRRLKNHNFSVISSNCNGGIMLHDLGEKFNSPTVNLLFSMHDFLKLVSDLDKYLSSDIIEIESDFPYPVGKLGDITVQFMHYNTFEEAQAKWNERCKRVNKDNIFIVATDKDGCTYDDLCTFDSLPYEHKIIFTHKPYNEFKSAYYIKGFEKEKEVGILSDFKQSKLTRRYIDDFDYVSFFNGVSVEELNAKRKDCHENTIR